jgi:hypothetical protein
VLLHRLHYTPPRSERRGREARCARRVPQRSPGKGVGWRRLRCRPRPVSIVPLPLGVVAAETGGEPAPEIQIDPVAFVSHKTHRLTICSFYALLSGFERPRPLGLLSQEPKVVVRKYIQSTLEEKLSTSDISVQWCSAKIVSGPVPHSSAQLSSGRFRLLTTSSWVKGDFHMLLPEDPWQGGIISYQVNALRLLRQSR